MNTLEILALGTACGILWFIVSTIVIISLVKVAGRGEDIEDTIVFKDYPDA